ncbi:MAG: hypothetical protein PF904_09730 [Kiritimatiellae bacterium]|jgi:hypothetical protein|nr:hypothetical protein [Kiritimatiellia bacterium]
MNVVSTTNWTVNPETIGMSLGEFASSEVPDMSAVGDLQGMLALVKTAKTDWGQLKKVRRIDLCLPPGADGVHSLNILPFSELRHHVKPGDIVIFVQRDTSQFWQERNWPQLVRQRGRHAELITRENEELFIRSFWQAPKTMRVPIDDPTSHKMLQERHDVSEFFHFHIFRLVKPEHISTCFFESNLEAWVKVLEMVDNPVGTWAFDPVDFTDIDSLRSLGDGLLASKDVHMMTCIEWTYTILCLAFCYPMTESFLQGRGVLEQFHQQHANGMLAEGEECALDTLPLAPYTVADVLRSFVSVYAENALLHEVSDENIEGMAKHFFGNKLPKKTMMPIVPLAECFRKAHLENLSVEYVVTALDAVEKSSIS